MTGVLFIEAIRYNACETPTSIVFHAASLYTWYNLYRSKSVHVKLPAHYGRNYY